MSGYSDVLIGAQFGDEGKGRIIDNNIEKYIGENIGDKLGEYDVAAKYNGGPNAGHSLKFGDKEIGLSQVASGIFHPNMLLYTGSGCVINPEKLLEEISNIEALEVTLRDRLHISDQATVIAPHHRLFDEITGGDIGTTKNGIGAAYADQAYRKVGETLKNIRLGDILDNPLEARSSMVDSYCDVARFFGREPGDIVSKVERTIDAVMELKQYINRDPLWLDTLVRSGKNVLFEGAQASMLDVTKGTVPYVTSSHTIAGSAYVGGDLSPKYHRKTMGVAKMIMSRVGNGPFASEFGGRKSELYCDERDKNGEAIHIREFEQSNYSIDKLMQSENLFDIGIALRMMRGEYGTVSKRPRRIGMFDLVALMHNCRINGVDELYLTKFDCLTDFSKTRLLNGIPIVTGYKLDGQNINYVPGSSARYRAVIPEITYFPHIMQDLSVMRKKAELPSEATDLISYIEKYAGCKVAGIGVGPDREQFITLR